MLAMNTYFAFPAMQLLLSRVRSVVRLGNDAPGASLPAGALR
jgi:hypothetical protein